MEIYVGIILIFQIKKTKNISQDVFGSKLGRIHMDTQDFSKLATKKMKGLRADRKEVDGEEESAAEEEDSDDAMDTLEMQNPVGGEYDDIGGDLDWFSSFWATATFDFMLFHAPQ